LRALVAIVRRAISTVILVVDDDPEFLGEATSALTLGGSQVLAARNAPEALKLIGKMGAAVDLALIDLTLGTASGFELIRGISAIDKGLPVIAFSGVSSLSTLQSATMLGAVEVLRKPINRKWTEAIERVRRHPIG
jgi:DNA-binding NtrC family response regulator